MAYSMLTYSINLSSQTQLVMRIALQKNAAVAGSIHVYASAPGSVAGDIMFPTYSFVCVWICAWVPNMVIIG